MRQLILHIGPGKSGSSALQSWLALNQDALARLGYAFHVSDPGARHFRINSGNAGALRTMLDHAVFPASEFERTYFRDQPNAIVSGEQLQLLDKTLAEPLLRWAAQESVDVTVMGVLRNAYDYLYSTWLQTIKRRNQVKPFASFVQRLSRFRHLDVVDHWETLATSHWIHYDSARDCLAQAFCARTGLDASALSKMRLRRFIRGLTPEEDDLLQDLVRLQTAACL